MRTAGNLSKNTEIGTSSPRNSHVLFWFLGIKTVSLLVYPDYTTDSDFLEKRHFLKLKQNDLLNK